MLRKINCAYVIVEIIADSKNFHPAVFGSLMGNLVDLFVLQVICVFDISSGCDYQGRSYTHGDIVSRDECTTCYCREGKFTINKGHVHAMYTPLNPTFI